MLHLLVGQQTDLKYKGEQIVEYHMSKCKMVSNSRFSNLKKFRKEFKEIILNCINQVPPKRPTATQLKERLKVRNGCFCLLLENSRESRKRR